MLNPHPRIRRSLASRVLQWRTNLLVRVSTVTAIIAACLVGVPCSATPEAQDPPVVVEPASTQETPTTEDEATENAEAEATRSSDIGIPDRLETELRRRFLEHRDELRDDKATYLNLWLVAVAIFLTVYGLIFSFFMFREQQRVKELGTQASESLKFAARYEETTRKTTHSALIAVTMGEAIAAQQNKDYLDAIDRWQETAAAAERTDARLAASAWFSVGFLREFVVQDDQKNQQLLRDAVTAYDSAIRLRPNYATAFLNRGNVKARLGQWDGAALDYSESTRISPSAAAYYNRANVRFLRADFRAAVEDYKEAMSVQHVRSDVAVGHILHNKANALIFAGEVGQAQQCLDMASGRPDVSEKTVNNRDVVNKIREIDPRPRISVTNSVDEDGQLILHLTLQTTLEKAEVLSGCRFSANSGNIGSTGSAEMPGGTGGKGAPGFKVVAHLPG